MGTGVLHIHKMNCTAPRGRERRTSAREAHADDIPQTPDDADELLDLAPLRGELFPHARVLVAHRAELRRDLGQ